MKRIFIDGLSGMAQGLFATLIIGTIIQQIGMFVGGNYGDLIYLIGKVAAALTGAGIGVGVARKLEAQQLVTVCAAVAGMIGAFAGKILAGQVLVDGNIVLAGPGEPLGAFVAAMWQLRLEFSYRKNKTRYYPDTIDLHWCWCGCWFVCRTTDFFLYELAWFLD